MNITLIRQTAEQIVGKALGSSFKVLPYQFDIAMNDERALNAGYTVTWDQASEVQSVIQCLNLVQEIKVTIVKRAFVRLSDEKVISEMDSLYDSVSSILKSFIEDKMGIPETIQEARLVSMGKPEHIGRDIVTVTIMFQVRYLVQ